MSESVAYLACGCFWGVQALFKACGGVGQTRVGYMGGALVNPTYDHVKTGHSGHAEAVEVIFDPEQMTYEDVLKFFFKIHDPTTLNQQGNDRGTQYRSAIFYTNTAQQATALDLIDRVNQSGYFAHPVVTELVEAVPFYEAEDFHQDYLDRYPHGYTCHYVRHDFEL